jgi:hypothetical protein
MYELNYEARRVEFVGDTLEVRTNEKSSCFFTGGSCVGPQATWHLRVSPERVDDLGTTPDDPELRLIDDLFQRIARRQDARDIASADAIRVLSPLLQEPSGKAGCSVGGLGRREI